MVILLLDELQKVLKHVVVGAAVNTRSHVLFTLVFFLDLSDEHFDFFFEQLVTFVLIVFVCGLKLDLDQVGAGLE